MNGNNPVKQFVPLGLLLIFFVFTVVSFVFLVLPNIENLDLYKPLPIEKDIGINEVMKMSKQDHEHENLLLKIREDLKIPQDLEVKIFVGPYVNIVNEGRLVLSNHPFGFFLLLNEFFYQELNPEEKIALISHELGHLTNDVVFLSYNPTDTEIRLQIEADTYATKHVNPEAMISVLNKANARHGGYPSRQYYLRIQNLERIKVSKQGH